MSQRQQGGSFTRHQSSWIPVWARRWRIICVAAAAAYLVFILNFFWQYGGQGLLPRSSFPQKHSLRKASLQNQSESFPSTEQAFREASPAYIARALPVPTEKDEDHAHQQLADIAVDIVHRLQRELEEKQKEIVKLKAAHSKELEQPNSPGIANEVSAQELTRVSDLLRSTEQKLKQAQVEIKSKDAELQLARQALALAATTGNSIKNSADALKFNGTDMASFEKVLSLQNEKTGASLTQVVRPGPADLGEHVQHVLEEYTAKLSIEDDRLFGHVYTTGDTSQVLYYARVVAQPWVKTVCEIGFAAGHSTVTYLAANPGLVVYSFDDYAREEIVNRGKELIEKMFPGRLRWVRRGQAGVTVPEVSREWHGSGLACDVVSIDGAHHANLPTIDIINMRLLAAYPNVVLLDDYSQEWPSVPAGFQSAAAELYMVAKGAAHESRVVFRGKRKSWLEGEYRMATAVIVAGAEAEEAKTQKIVSAYLSLWWVRDVIVLSTGMWLGGAGERVRVVVRGQDELPALHTDAVLVHCTAHTPSIAVLKSLFSAWWEQSCSAGETLVQDAGRARCVRRGHLNAVEEACSFSEGVAVLPRGAVRASLSHANASSSAGGAPGPASQRYCAHGGFPLLGRCFCQPGWSGAGCEERWAEAVPACGQGDDRCFYHPEYGTAQVSSARWRSAQGFEKDTWITRQTDVDRNFAHAESFGFYQALPQHLGTVLEIGCGPFTQLKTILHYRNATLDSVTLLDPQAHTYQTSVPSCSYKNGKLLGVLPTTIIERGGEDLPTDTQYDTVVMINVIEHCYDAFRVLQNLYAVVKPGGWLVFHERLWDAYSGTGFDRTFLLHPIRIKTALFEFFTSHFTEVYRIDRRQSKELQRLRNDGQYFIGRKPAAVAMGAKH